MNRELLLAILTFTGGYLVGRLDAYFRWVKRLRFEKALLVQVSGELCDECGWAMKFPDAPCRCELERELQSVHGHQLLN